LPLASVQTRLFVQEISSDLTQQELFPQYSPEDLPITPLLDAEGKPVLVQVLWMTK